ncbi:MAG: exodeoxyribonuclease V subunit gamma [Pseudomonadaceae bacterium]
MRLHRSNRVERLLDALTDVVGPPLPDPLQPECIVVSSRGMNTWLSMQLSERLGVWAGGQFPFPRRFVDDLFAKVAPQGPAWTDPQQLLWPILAELPALLGTPPFIELRRFVERDDTGRHLFQLAHRIAHVFDQYPVFRPEMVLGWDAGAEDHWQAVLWRAINDRLGGQHVAASAQDFIDALEDAPPEGLPARVSLFGVTTLPPFYVHVLQALDKVVPVHLFVVSPSQEYWAELRRHGMAPEVLDAVPPLLVSLGGVGREFQGVLEQVDYQEDETSLYVDPGQESSLTALQSRMLHLQGQQTELHKPTAGDPSITLHACHSPMREVEVLHDHLLAMLADDPTLQPRDIAVLLTDVETYAPLVEAVFERNDDDPAFIPFCVADRSVRAENPLVDAFIRIIGMVGGRVTASEVLDLLALEPVQARFGIAADELDRIASWVEGAKIRWGIDADHRGKHGQPKLGENTWRFGLHRLFLGAAMRGGGLEMFADVLPFDEIEGASSELLGRFGQFCEALFAAVLGLEAARPVDAWQRDLEGMLQSLLVDPSAASQWDPQPLRGALDAIAKDAQAARFEDELGLEAILELVETRLESDAPPRGFLAKGVTFCAMLPMRSVPFRVVCMLGLSDGAFPRGGRTMSFDQVANDPKPGDRSRRADDRYLFLEALLAARQRVHLSYVGQSIQDNADLPPSVVVSDLLDQLVATIEPPAPLPSNLAGVRETVRVRHPMQPFSPRYFGADSDPRLFSFSADYCEGARALLDPSKTHGRPALLTEPLPDPRALDPGASTLSLDRLLKFYKLPVADLVKRRLGVFLENRDSRDYSDREPMEVAGLDDWRLGDTVLRHELADMDQDDSLALTRAGGLVPLGTPGACTHEETHRAVSPLIAAAVASRDGDALEPLLIDLPFSQTRVVGTLGERWPSGRVHLQYSKRQPKSLLQLWIQHLCLCAMAPDDQAMRSTLVARAQRKDTPPEICAFGPVEGAPQLLDDLCELYWIGQREPLLLFPTASHNYMAEFRASGDPQAARWKATNGWQDRSFERKDPHVQRVFGDDDVFRPGYSPLRVPLAAGDAGTVAQRVFGPLLDALQETTR